MSTRPRKYDKSDNSKRNDSSVNEKYSRRPPHTPPKKKPKNKK